MEDNLQIAAQKLNKILTDYGFAISAQKTKSMTFKGRDPVRNKIVIDKIIEKANLFNYLGNMISYEGELDIDNKLTDFLKITDILGCVFRLCVCDLNRNKAVQYISPSSLVIWQRNLDY